MFKKLIQRLSRGQTALGLELTDQDIKLCEIQQFGSHGIRVSQFAARSLAGGVVQDGRIQDMKQVEDAIRNLLATERWSTKVVNLAIPSPNVMIRTLKLPDVKPRQMHKLLEHEIKHHMHIPFEDAHYDYTVLPLKQAATAPPATAQAPVPTVTELEPEERVEAEESRFALVPDEPLVQQSEDGEPEAHLSATTVHRAETDKLPEPDNSPVVEGGTVTENGSETESGLKAEVGQKLDQLGQPPTYLAQRALLSSHKAAERQRAIIARDEAAAAQQEVDQILSRITGQPGLLGQRDSVNGEGERQQGPVGGEAGTGSLAAHSPAATSGRSADMTEMPATVTLHYEVSEWTPRNARLRQDKPKRKSGGKNGQDGAGLAPAQPDDAPAEQVQAEQMRVSQPSEALQPVVQPPVAPTPVSQPPVAQAPVVQPVTTLPNVQPTAPQPGKGASPPLSEPSEPSEPEQRLRDVMMVAASRETLDSYADLCERLGLRPGSIELRAFALQRLQQRFLPQYNDGACLLVDINQTNCDLTIIDDGVIKLTRDVELQFAPPAGRASGGEAGSSEEQPGAGLFGDYLQLNPVEVAGWTLEAACQDLASELGRLMNFYRYSLGNRERELKAVVVSGNLGQLDKAVGLLRTAMSPQQVLLFASDQYEAPGKPQWSLPYYAVAMGLALRGKQP